MQVIGDLDWVEWLEEHLDDVTETDDKDVELVHGFRRQRCLRSISIPCKIRGVDAELELLGRLVEGNAVVTHEQPYTPISGLPSLTYI